LSWLASFAVTVAARRQLILYGADSPQQYKETGMAQKTTVTLEDDLDGGPAAETVRFAFGGTAYEIDLNKKNARAFRKQLAPFVEHARKAGRGQRRPRTRSTRQRSGEIRVWAKEQGITVSERGRIPASVVEQYQTAIR
jgi:D-serine deaminase-like pyridoxal phosphate-dependent protein